MIMQHQDTGPYLVPLRSTESERHLALASCLGTLGLFPTVVAQIIHFGHFWVGANKNRKPQKAKLSMILAMF